MFSFPEDSSIAETNKIPSTSNENRTFILGIPAGLGSNPDNTNSSSVLFAEVTSLSPCKILIFIEVCPFSLVVKICSLMAGMGEFLGIIFSISPPIVSIPSDKGVTSKRRFLEPFNSS